MTSRITVIIISAFLIIISCNNTPTSPPPPEPKSKPGKAWTVVNLDSVVGLMDITSSGSIHVAVCSNGEVVRSTDGINWDKIETPATYSLKRVECFDTIFIAVGAGEYIMTSPDGLHWTERRSGNMARSLCDVTHAESNYIAVGGHSASGTSLGDVRISPDGVDWELIEIDFEGWMNGIAWTGEKFISAGHRSGSPFSGEDYSIWTSTNLTEWKLMYTGLAISFAEDICWSGDLLVVVVGTRPGSILTSFDSIQWIVREQELDSRLYSVCWTGNQFVAVGSDGVILTSDDGITWTKRDSGSANGLRGVWGNSDMIIAVGDSQILISYK